MADDRNDAAGYLGWFFLGGIIGAASALLLSPKTGREIRDQLIERGGEFARRAQEMAQGHAGDWRTCVQCRADHDVSPLGSARNWYTTNLYNFTPALFDDVPRRLADPHHVGKIS